MILLEGAHWPDVIKRYLYDTLHLQAIIHAFVDVSQAKDNRFNGVFQGRLVGIGNLEKSGEGSPNHLQNAMGFCGSVLGSGRVLSRLSLWDRGNLSVCYKNRLWWGNETTMF